MRQVIAVSLVLLLGCAGNRAPEQEPVEGEVARFASHEGKGQGTLYTPRQAKGRLPAVIVLHGDHGLTDTIHAHARRISEMGYVVLALDLYRGEKIDSLLDAHIMDRGLPEERVKADLRGAVDFLLSRREVRGEAIGIIGWDMGGGYALDAAMADPRLRAVVTCYGRLTTDSALLARMQGSVLAIMAGKDEGNPPATREAFRAAMKEAGKKLVAIHVFEECNHGFMNPPGKAKPAPADEQAAAKAWQAINDYLSTELGRE